jgi:hypothetical protein
MMQLHAIKSARSSVITNHSNVRQFVVTEDASVHPVASIVWSLMIYLVIGLSHDGYYALTKTVNDREDAKGSWSIHPIITDDEIHAVAIIVRHKRKLPNPDVSGLDQFAKSIIGTYEITPPELIVFLKLGMAYQTHNTYGTLKRCGATLYEQPDLDTDMERAGYGCEWIAYRLWGDKGFGV